MAFLELYGVSKAYRSNGGYTEVLHDINLSIEEGEFVAIVGYSGSGKTTLISLIGGLIKPDAGTLTLNGARIRGPGPDRGMVFQNYSLLPWLTTYENVYLAVDQIFPNWRAAEKKAHMERYIAMVNLLPAQEKYPAELSQGMRQRVGIARAFALSPKMLLLDEPFGMLDSLTRFELQKVLLDLWGRNQKTALMVTHDVDEALYLADRVVMMTNGPEAEVGDILEVHFPRPRDRKAIMDHPDYYPLREYLITFLEERANQRPSVSSKQPPRQANENIIEFTASPPKDRKVSSRQSAGLQDGIQQAEKIPAGTKSKKK
jgi:nitrate ABC transporter ATP-binding subunit